MDKNVTLLYILVIFPGTETLLEIEASQLIYSYAP